MTIISVDIGNGNIKTEHSVTRAGLAEYDTEPIVAKDYYAINGKYYVLGDSHNTYTADKTGDSNCYLMTIIAIAKEMEYLKLYDEDIHLAVGLPLGWCSSNDKLKLMKYYQDKLGGSINVKSKEKDYRFSIVDIDIFPQGFAAVCGRYNMRGMNMLVDIGNGTINMMQIQDGKPLENTIITERIGVSSLVENIQHSISREYGDDVPETIVDSYLFGDAGGNGRLRDLVDQVATNYSNEVLKRISSAGFRKGLMRLYIIGGGGQILKRYSDISTNPDIVFIDDICANAKGYAFLTRMKLDMIKRG